MYVVRRSSLLRTSFNVAACNFFQPADDITGILFFALGKPGAGGNEGGITTGVWSMEQGRKRGWRVGMAEGRYG